MTDKFQALRDQVSNASISEDGGIYSFDPKAWDRECTPPVIRALLAELDQLLAAQAPAQPVERGRCVGWRAVWRNSNLVWYSSKVISTEAEVDRVLAHWRAIWPKFSVESGGQFSFEKEALYAHPAPSQPDRAVMQQEFMGWAGRKGYDTAHTYNTDCSEWVWLNPMTADLWGAWRAALSATLKPLDPTP